MKKTVIGYEIERWCYKPFKQKIPSLFFGAWEEAEAKRIVERETKFGFKCTLHTLWEELL